MFGNEAIQNFGIVSIPPQDLNDAAVDTAWCNLAQYGHATVVINVGDTAGGTFAVTLNEATDASGTGEQTLAYSKIYSTAQKLLIDATQTSGTFVVGETITGGTSSLTAEVYQVSTNYLIVRCLTGGTTWTTTETLTGGTSGATTKISGTGQDEDTFVTTYTAPSSTFTVPAVTFKSYVIEVDADMLSDGYSHLQVALADPGAATIAGGVIILTQPHVRGIPMPSAIGTQKMVATFA